MENNFKVHDSVIPDKHNKRYIDYEYNPKKLQSQLTNMFVYDLETFNTKKAVPFASCIYRLSTISGKYKRDITQRGNEKCRKDCIVFKGTDSFNEMLNYVLQFEGEAKNLLLKLLKRNYTYLLIKDQDLIVMLFSIICLNGKQLLV